MDLPPCDMQRPSARGLGYLLKKRTSSTVYTSARVNDCVPWRGGALTTAPRQKATPQGTIGTTEGTPLHLCIPSPDPGDPYIYDKPSGYGRRNTSSLVNVGPASTSASSSEDLFKHQIHCETGVGERNATKGGPVGPLLATLSPESERLPMAKPIPTLGLIQIFIPTTPGDLSEAK